MANNNQELNGLECVSSERSGRNPTWLPNLLWDITNPGETGFETFTGLVRIYDRFDNAAPLHDASALTFELLAVESLVGTPTARLMSMQSIDLMVLSKTLMEVIV